MPDITSSPSAMVPDEDFMLRRVGEAIALQWRFLPEPVRTVILNQTETISFRSERPEATRQLRSFLEEYAQHR